MEFNFDQTNGALVNWKSHRKVVLPNYPLALLLWMDLGWTRLTGATGQGKKKMGEVAGPEEEEKETGGATIGNVYQLRLVEHLLGKVSENGGCGP
jgi:hypothetical protein